MKIKVIKKAYYNSQLLKVNMIIDYDGDIIPSWAKGIDNIQRSRKSTAKKNKK